MSDLLNGKLKDFGIKIRATCWTEKETDFEYGIARVRLERAAAIKWKDINYINRSH